MCSVSIGNFIYRNSVMDLPIPFILFLRLSSLHPPLCTTLWDIFFCDTDSIISMDLLAESCERLSLSFIITFSSVLFQKTLFLFLGVVGAFRTSLGLDKGLLGILLGLLNGLVLADVDGLVEQEDVGDSAYFS